MGATLDRVIGESLEEATFDLRPDGWKVARLVKTQGEYSQQEETKYTTPQVGENLICFKNKNCKTEDQCKSEGDVGTCRITRIFIRIGRQLKGS